MRYFIFIVLLIVFSCNESSNLKPEQIKTGTFKTILTEGNYESIATRDNNIQIETYNQKKDTFYIKWKSNFEYSLIKKSPKNDLDKKEFVVKITGVKQNEYTFTAYYKGSNFKQKGTATKIN